MRKVLVASLLFLTACAADPKHGDAFRQCLPHPTTVKPCAEVRKSDQTLTVRYRDGDVPNIHLCDEVKYDELCYIVEGGVFKIHNPEKGKP